MKTYLLTMFGVAAIWSTVWFGIAFAGYSWEHPTTWIAGATILDTGHHIPKTFIQYLWLGGYYSLGGMVLTLTTIGFLINYFDKKIRNEKFNSSHDDLDQLDVDDSAAENN